MSVGSIVIASLLAFSTVALDSGNLTLKAPSDVSITKHAVNWETDSYTLRRKADGRQLLDIVVGGGSVDLKPYTGFCLNHKRAWRLKQSNSVNVIIGNPGVNSVFISYMNLSRQDAIIAEKIISSVKFNDGVRCR